MKTGTVAWIVVSAIALAATVLVPAGDSAAEASEARSGERARFGDPGCSVRKLAGRWLFATDVGDFTPADSKITALGTMHIDVHGHLEGTFDATFQNPAVGFVKGASYTGSIVVNEDCTATVEFVTSESTARTDSVGIVSSNEMWGMSQLPENIWTYRARRISSRPPQLH